MQSHFETRLERIKTLRSAHRPRPDITDPELQNMPKPMQNTGQAGYTPAPIWFSACGLCTRLVMPVALALVMASATTLHEGTFKQSNAGDDYVEALASFKNQVFHR